MVSPAKLGPGRHRALACFVMGLCAAPSKRRRRWSAVARRALRATLTLGLASCAATTADAPPPRTTSPAPRAPTKRTSPTSDAQPVEQAAARQLFLRLVTLGEGVEDTRRRIRRSELDGLGEAVEPVIERFGTFRLLSFDRDPVTLEPTVEIAHDPAATVQVDHERCLILMGAIQPGPDDGVGNRDLEVLGTPHLGSITAEELFRAQVHRPGFARGHLVHHGYTLGLRRAQDVEHLLGVWINRHGGILE